MRFLVRNATRIAIAQTGLDGAGGLRVTDGGSVTDQLALFREEVFKARNVRLEGEVLLYHPIKARAVTALLACSTIGLAVWATTGRYARTEIAKGMLVTDAETAKIIALHPGVVTRIAVNDGQSVHRGQVLATVQIDEQYAEGGRATEEGLNTITARQRLGVHQIVAARSRGLSERVGLTATVTSAIDVVAQVIAWLDEEAAKPAWWTRVEASRQGELF